MKKSILFLIIMLLTTVAAYAEDYDEAEFDERSIIVVTQPKPGSSISLFSVDDPFQAIGVKSIENLDKASQNRISLFSTDASEKLLLVTLENPGHDNVLEAIETLNQSPLIKYAEPNYIYTLFATANDTFYYQQYGLEKIGAPAVWDMDISCSDVTVAIIDSGMMMTHPDLKDNLWKNPGEVAGDGIDNDGNGYIDDVNGVDFAPTTLDVENYDPKAYDVDPTDISGHGTHVAGIVSATTNNNKGVASLARDAKLLPLKIFDKEGKTSSDRILRAIKYLEEKNIPIVNNSYGGSGLGSAIPEEISKCKNSVFVCAAGNTGANNDYTPVYPASFAHKNGITNLISVAASDENDELSTFQTGSSNFGAASVHIAAPGHQINSTYYYKGSAEYAPLDGTSMACPMVSSAAAVLKAKYPNMTPEEIIEKLKSSVDPVEALADKVSTGGRLNAYEALLIHATSVTLNKSYVRLNMGATIQLQSSALPSNITDTPVWTSSNESVATVTDNGLVTSAGGEGTAVISVTYGKISKECTIVVDVSPPTADVQYSTTDLTNQDVTATLVNISEPINETDLSYTFSENGKHTFIITDMVGKVTEIEAEVTWIDKTPPTADIQYSTTDPTSQTVTATLTNISKEIVETDLSYTFTENDSHVFTLTDKAGNTTKITAEVTWIDKTPPTAEVEYSTTDLTNQDVTAVLKNVSEEVEETELSYTFTENSKHTFTLTDKAGNTAEITAEVTWIDRTPPTALVQYSTIFPTNKDVITALVNVSKPIREKNLSYTFTENGSHIFTITDLAGNTAEITAEVNWIDKTPPTAEIKYTPDTETEGSVTAEIIPSETIKETAESDIKYTFNENGSHIFKFTDIAGNVGTVEAVVDWIITPDPSPSVEPEKSPDPSPSVEPENSPDPSPSVEPEKSPDPSPSVEPEKSPDPSPNVEPEKSPDPSPSVEPENSPDPSPSPIVIPEPRDRIEFTKSGDNITARLIFEETQPAASEEIVLYAAYKENGLLKRVEKLTVNSDMTAYFTLPTGFEDCDISLYVWDNDMKPKMDIQNLEI